MGRDEEPDDEAKDDGDDDREADGDEVAETEGVDIVVEEVGVSRARSSARMRDVAFPFLFETVLAWFTVPLPIELEDMDGGPRRWGGALIEVESGTAELKHIRLTVISEVIRDMAGGVGNSPGKGDTIDPGSSCNKCETQSLHVRQLGGVANRDPLSNRAKTNEKQIPSDEKGPQTTRGNKVAVFKARPNIWESIKIKLAHMVASTHQETMVIAATRGAQITRSFG
ncbi:hypothetical protein FA15DRAFT_660933 [Coprinopsis marcescibilis]|uniref:Uncharacterized protein n=1 Tax=Coprinopsis marcescibilis TaxID=230819 RepID=A0A5C3KE26_COPMA|nr:hypothetical protein FA15DRAFT_660933 [Coprinopsis marcescibilis]